jgi:hypothetical protein
MPNIAVSSAITTLSFVRTILDVIQHLFDERQFPYTQSLACKACHKSNPRHRRVDQRVLSVADRSFFFSTLFQKSADSPFTTLNAYLSKTKQRHFPSELYQSLSDDPHSVGSLLIMATLFDHFGKFRRDDFSQEWGENASHAMESKDARISVCWQFAFSRTCKSSGRFPPLQY